MTNEAFMPRLQPWRRTNQTREREKSRIPGPPWFVDGQSRAWPVTLGGGMVEELTATQMWTGFKSNYATGNKRKRRKYRAIEAAKWFETKEGKDAATIHNLRKAAVEKAAHGFIAGDGCAISEAFFEFVNESTEIAMTEIYKKDPP